MPQIRMTLDFELVDFGLNNFLMALTPSTMLPLGTPAPDFQLPDTDDKTVSLTGFKDKAAIDEWLNGAGKIKWLRTNGYAK